MIVVLARISINISITWLWYFFFFFCNKWTVGCQDFVLDGGRGVQTFPKLCPHLNQAQGRVGKFYNLNRRSDKMFNSFGYPLCTVAIRGKISLQVALVLMIARVARECFIYIVEAEVLV